jgi:hypothetical protein
VGAGDGVHADSFRDRPAGSEGLQRRVVVRLPGRRGTFTAIVETRRKTALIGAIVLADLDRLVD